VFFNGLSAILFCLSLSSLFFLHFLFMKKRARKNDIIITLIFPFSSSLYFTGRLINNNSPEKWWSPSLCHTLLLLPVVKLWCGDRSSSVPFGNLKSFRKGITSWIKISHVIFLGFKYFKPHDFLRAFLSRYP